jgi:hypothetical protein
MTRACLLLAFCTALAWLAISFAAGPAPAQATSDQRVYELRTYTCNPGKLDALHKRFRDNTNRLFTKHGMAMIGYWVPQDEKDGKDNTLVYMLSFPSREAAKKAWAAFVADPEWKRVKAESEKDGVLVGNVKSVYLDPTDYSPLK